MCLYCQTVEKKFHPYIKDKNSINSFLGISYQVLLMLSLYPYFLFSDFQNEGIHLGEMSF